MQTAMVRIWVPVPTHAQNSDRCGGKRNTSPWMYFHPVSSWSSAGKDTMTPTSPSVPLSRLCSQSLPDQGMLAIVVAQQGESNEEAARF